MKSKSLFFNSGNTIVELILYLGLLSIFILMLTGLFSQILTAQTGSVTDSYLQTNGNFLLTKLSSDINSADSIITPAAIGTSSVSLTLKTGTENTSYSVVNHRLVLTDSSGSYNLNDVDTVISDFNVIRLGNPDGKNGLQISYQITSVIPNQDVKSRNFSTFITIR